MKPSQILRKLIRACVDDERTLLDEREFVDAARGEALTRLTRERERFVADQRRSEPRSAQQRA